MGQIKNSFTSDESLFRLLVTKCKTKVQYIFKSQSQKKWMVNSATNFSRGLMVWFGMYTNGHTQVWFVKPRVKIDSDYYMKKILKPFFRFDVPK